MLLTYINKTPLSKFLLIEDSVQVPGSKLLDFIISNHIRNDKHKIHYIVTEGPIYRQRKKFYSPKVTFYNLLDDVEQLETVLSNICDNCVVVINSIAHMLYQHKFSHLMKILNKAKQNDNIVQLVCLLHQDILENGSIIRSNLEYLSTLSIELIYMGKNIKPRLLYKYKKSSGKIVRQHEEYYFSNDRLISEPLKKLDPKQLVQESMKAVLPENLTTFKIGLEDKEKEERDKLILPYLPRDQQTGRALQGEGQVFYELEEADDWDPEDPDDDLDF